MKKDIDNPTTSGLMGSHASVTINGKTYRADSLAKKGAFAGFKVGIALHIGDWLASILTKKPESLYNRAIRPVMQRRPLIMPAIIAGAAIGGLAQAFEHYTGSTTISDLIVVITPSGDSGYKIEIKTK